MPQSTFSLEQLRWITLALADHLWQSTAIALLALIAARLLRDAPARLRYSALLIGMAKFIFPLSLLSHNARLEPFFDFAAQHIRLHSQGSHLILTRGIEPASHTLPRLGLWPYFLGWAPVFEAFVGIWLSGSILLFAWWFCRRQIFSVRLRRSIFPEESERIQPLIDKVRLQLGLRKQVKPVVSPEIEVPGVWRIFRPVILLPPDLDLQLEDEEFETVLLHELTHVKRRDNLAGTVQMVVCNIFWFHPVVWYLHRQLMREREYHCDEEVIKISKRPTVYASGFLKVLQNCIGQTAPDISSVVSNSDVRLRFTKMISSEPVPEQKRRHRVILTSLYVTITFCILTASLLAGNRFSRSAIYNNANTRIYFPGGIPGRADGYWLSPVRGRQAYQDWKNKTLMVSAEDPEPPHFYLSETTEKVSSRNALVSVCVVPLKAPYRIEVRPVIITAIDGQDRKVERLDGVSVLVQEKGFSENVFELSVNDQVTVVEVKITALENEKVSQSLVVGLHEGLDTGLAASVLKTR